MACRIASGGPYAGSARGLIKPVRDGLPLDPRLG